MNRRNIFFLVVFIVILLLAVFLRIRQWGASVQPNNSRETSAVTKQSGVQENTIKDSDISFPTDTTPMLGSQEFLRLQKEGRFFSVRIEQQQFIPQTIRIQRGDTIFWNNVADTSAWVASDNHPTHLLYTKLNLPPIQAGKSASRQFNESGTYTYHNHLRPQMKGIVIVQ